MLHKSAVTMIYGWGCGGREKGGGHLKKQYCVCVPLSTVCSPLSVRYGAIEMTTIIIIIFRK